MSAPEQSVVVAIIAHDEEHHMARVIGETLAQDAFRDPGLAITFLVVANGCSDRTVEVSREALAAAGGDVRHSVVHLDAPSKTRAWNHLIHALCPDDTDYVVALDADISYTSPDAITALIAVVRDDPDLRAAVSTPVVAFQEGEGSALVRRFHQIRERGRSNSATFFCGQLYCARYDVLRRLHLPRGLSTQDGFIGAVLLTDALTRPQDLSRIQVVPSVRHLHPEHPSFGAIYRRSRREIENGVVYKLVYELFHTLPPSMDARMQEVARLNRETPAWVEEMTERRVAQPRPVVARDLRWRSLRQAMASRRRPMFYALLPALMIFDLVLVWDAERRLRKAFASEGGSGSIRFDIR